MTSFPKWIWMNNSFNHVILYHFVLVWLHVWQTITDCIGVFHVHFICMIGVMAYLSAPMVPIGHHDCRQVNYALQSVTSTFQSFFYEEKEVFGHRNRHGEMGGWNFDAGKQRPHWLLGVPSKFHEPYQVTIKPMGNGWKWCWYLGIQTAGTRTRASWNRSGRSIISHCTSTESSLVAWPAIDRWIDFDLDIDALLGGDLCFFKPLLGEMIWLTGTFEMGWCNHQLDCHPICVMNFFQHLG